MKGDVLDMRLLAMTDPDPVEWVNPDSDAPVLLLCEHAGQAIPQALGDLLLPPGAIDAHIGWDIGAEALARALADRLGAPLILQRYSRLVIDCNRPPGTAESVPVVSDHIAIPANAAATPENLMARNRDIFEPLNAAIVQGFQRHKRRAAFSIHSFTPQMNGQARPWHAGFLSRADTQTARLLLDHVTLAAPEIIGALNQPYQISNSTDWFIPAQVEPRGLRHALIEIRNDQLGNVDGIERWAGLLSDAIQSLPETETWR